MAERKRKRAVTVTLAELVMPINTNIVGTMYGGDVLKGMDMAASLAALRFARKTVVTASSDAVDFHQPIRPGHIVEQNARVVLTGHTSMVVKIEVYGEEPLSGDRYHCCSAFFTFVALGPDGKPALVPELIIETDAEKADQDRALRVRDAARNRLRLFGESSIKNTLASSKDVD
jgi:acyl-CoA hydrolase